jgi:hypothetical protein
MNWQLQRPQTFNQARKVNNQKWGALDQIESAKPEMAE